MAPFCTVASRDSSETWRLGARGRPRKASSIRIGTASSGSSTRKCGRKVFEIEKFEYLAFLVGKRAEHVPHSQS
jgi:hypothetical protein